MALSTSYEFELDAYKSLMRLVMNSLDAGVDVDNTIIELIKQLKKSVLQSGSERLIAEINEFSNRLKFK